ncbi:MAG: 5-bromo-4-chloroindolyl phosphate hydrolysis family protein [Oscillospiraceae bacterium]|nr:5-bromo-4-chloroindolyl phosphate hydrolysis family protein [Oscillospiraceae bacterium]
MKKEVKKRSAIPIWAAGGLWLAWSAFAPMYKLWHFGLCAAACAACYLALGKVCPSKTITVPDAAPNTGNRELDAVIVSGRNDLKKIRAINDAVPDAGFTQQLGELESLAGQIFDKVQADEKQLPQIRRFLDYYLPTTCTLLEKYQSMYQQRSKGENVRAAMARIEQLLGTVVVAFRKQLDALYEADVMDITADIQVMEAMLQSSGLTQQKDF